MNIIVTGGAGYIGSIAVKQLCDAGHQVTVIDNLSKGRPELVDSRATLITADTTIFEDIKDHFEHISVVMHFAAYKAVGESMQHADQYVDNSIGLSNVLKAMVMHKVPRIIFSSTAAVYGNPEYMPLDEKHPTKPESFYGATKLQCEELLKWFNQIHNIEYVALRYFNVAGDGGLKYIDPNAQNIFPIIMEATKGTRTEVLVFGNDFKTPDGTGVRDYIHVTDLVDAHMEAIHWESGTYNLGTGKGTSVLELLQAFSKALGKDVPYKIIARRAGDPAESYATVEKAKKQGWVAKKSIQDMVESTISAYNSN
jgi:UDP-glucose 4-epimerase